MEQTHTDIQHALELQTRSAASLLKLLKMESKAVVQGDLKSLGDLMEHKVERCSQLTGLDQQLKVWMNHQELDSWLKDQTLEVRQQWSELVSCLKLCQTQNDANGLLIQQRQTEIERKLRPEHDGTYGASGQSLPQQGSNLQFSA